MNADWKMIECGICVLFTENAVHVQNDEALECLLLTERKDGAFHAAAAMKREYLKEWGREFPVRERSLACEIYWHYKIKEWAAAHEKKHGKRKLSTWLLLHMEVIDCGSRKSDNNRFLWDLLAVFFRRKERG